MLRRNRSYFTASNRATRAERKCRRMPSVPRNGKELDPAVKDLPIIRTSERRTFKECQQKWWWAWRCGLKPKNENQVALWFGTGIHLALAEWYCGPGLKRGPHPADTWEQYVGEEVWAVNTSGKGEDAKWIDAKELGTAMLEGYIEKYGADDSWHIIAPEQTFRIQIENASGKPQALYVGTFDLVYFDLEDETFKLGEHKTAKTISLDHLPLDDQAGSYWAIAGAVLEDRGYDLKGGQISEITYNFLKKALPDPRPENAAGEKLNKNGTVSKRQPGALFVREPVPRDRAERATQIRRISNEAAWMAAARRSPDRITKNPTKDCSRFCDFYTMCMLHERGGDDWKDYRDAMFRVRDPYADHRKSTDG